MNKKLFLEAVKAALQNRELDWKEAVTEHEWGELFQIALEQNVLPMVYQSIYTSEVFHKSGFRSEGILKAKVRQMAISQIMRTGEFIQLYKALSTKGLKPIVVKGIICRNLYPQPDNRISGDEDLYIPAGTYEVYHQALLEAGMEIADWDKPNIDVLHEISYVKKGGMLRIELHKDLFDGEEQAYAGMNEQFANVFSNVITVKADGTEICTMGYSDHLLFLIVHAFKHFISSGVGIRQVCDMVMFANAYGNQIDWQFVLDECEKIHADVFAAALFDMGYKYLGFDMERACYPEIWKRITVDSEEILDDMLSAGVFGSADMNRKHSSSITLNAVSAERQGKKAEASTLKTLFPSRKYLEGRYQYLKKYPFLLPVAWVQRICKYGMEIRKAHGGKSAVESMEIGSRRVELMKKYKIM